MWLNLPRVLNTDNVSKEALDFGLEIMKVLLEEAEKQKRSSVTANTGTGLKTIKQINPIIPYNTVHEMLVILQHEIHDAKTGRTSNKYCCNDCEEFEALEVTVFGKISGSCQSGPDIPLASDPACKHFKLKED